MAVVFSPVTNEYSELSSVVRTSMVKYVCVGCIIFPMFSETQWSRKRGRDCHAVLYERRFEVYPTAVVSDRNLRSEPRSQSRVLNETCTQRAPRQFKAHTDVRQGSDFNARIHPRVFP